MSERVCVLVCGFVLNFCCLINCPAAAGARNTYTICTHVYAHMQTSAARVHTHTHLEVQAVDFNLQARLEFSEVPGIVNANGKVLAG